MSLAVTRIFRARWSREIHAEWMRSVAADRPEIPYAELEQCRVLMDRAIPDALVEGYESIVQSLTLPDPGDHHVLAAAIHGETSLIVTFNLRDFPADELDRFGVQAVHPDDFVCGLLNTHRETVCRAFRAQRLRLKSPPLTALDLIMGLERCGLVQTARRLREKQPEL